MSTVGFWNLDMSGFRMVEKVCVLVFRSPLCKYQLGIVDQHQDIKVSLELLMMTHIWGMLKPKFFEKDNFCKKTEHYFFIDCKFWSSLSKIFVLLVFLEESLQNSSYIVFLKEPKDKAEIHQGLLSQFSSGRVFNWKWKESSFYYGDSYPRAFLEFKYRWTSSWPKSMGWDSTNCHHFFLFTARKDSSSRAWRKSSHSTWGQFQKLAPALRRTVRTLCPHFE